MKNIRSMCHQLMRKHGMSRVFGNPGSNELPFLKDFPKDFQYILGLHEGAVVSMADGYALASGQPVLVNLHAAAGTGNAMGALTNAWYSHSPLVITAGQQARNLIGAESMLTNVDAASLPRPLVKWSYEPAQAADLPRALSQAIYMANQPARGPVYLSIPYDDWEQPADANMEHLLDRQVQTAGLASEAQLQALVDQLNAARNPVLVLGPAVDAALANAAAVALAERLACPVWVAPSESRCPFPNRHACFRGILPISAKGIHDRLAGHDLILVAGAPVFRYHQNIPGPYLPEGAALIHLTADPAEAARAPIGQALVGDLLSTLEQLAVRVSQADRALPVPLPPAPRGVDEADRMRPENLFYRLNQLAPEDAIYVKEATATKGEFWQQIEMKHPGSYYFPAAGGLGFGLPAAVGVQMAQPQRRVIAVIGDGSANYGITGLWSAAQYQVPVIFIILKNGTYGALRGFAKLMEAEDAPGLDVPGLDFCALAEGYGVESAAASNAAGFEAAFKTALSEQRPFLIEVATTFGASH